MEDLNAYHLQTKGIATLNLLLIQFIPLKQTIHWETKKLWIFLQRKLH